MGGGGGGEKNSWQHQHCNSIVCEREREERESRSALEDDIKVWGKENKNQNTTVLVIDGEEGSSSLGFRGPEAVLHSVQTMYLLTVAHKST